MSSSESFGFEQLTGEIQEFKGRVMRLQLHDDAGNLVGEAEGELTIGTDEPGELSFQLGGTTPPEREDVLFFAASWIRVDLHAERLLEARWTELGSSISPAVLVIRLVGGLRLSLWPAMPPRQQWTEAHDAVRS